MNNLHSHLNIYTKNKFTTFFLALRPNLLALLALVSWQPQILLREENESHQTGTSTTSDPVARHSISGQCPHPNTKGCRPCAQGHCLPAQGLCPALLAPSWHHQVLLFHRNIPDIIQTCSHFFKILYKTLLRSPIPLQLLTVPFLSLKTMLFPFPCHLLFTLTYFFPILLGQIWAYSKVEKLLKYSPFRFPISIFPHLLSFSIW